jgi:hypothetical protein
MGIKTATCSLSDSYKIRLTAMGYRHLTRTNTDHPLEGERKIVHSLAKVGKRN